MSIYVIIYRSLNIFSFFIDKCNETVKFIDSIK
jgi:hypothetical protein